MTNLTPNRRAPAEVEGPLISSGMGRGMHTWVAIALTIVGVSLGLIAQSITTSVLGFLLLAAAIGLLGEVPRLLAAGEVRARVASGGDPAKANRFLVIRRDDSPGRFYLYVIIYLALGSFSFLAACGVFMSLLTLHAA